MGNKFIGAMVNNRIVPIDYELQNGDIVKILTSPHGKPSRDWLNIAKSSRAKSKIRSYFRQLEKSDREEKLAKGKEYLVREIKKRLSKEKDEDKDKEVVLSTAVLNKVAKDAGYSNAEDLLVAIGSGEMGSSQVASKYLGLETSKAIKEEPPLDTAKEREESKTYDTEIVVQGIEGLLVSRANCCKPIPGDPIIGVVTKRRGVTVHNRGCPNVEKVPEERLVEVEWGHKRSDRYSTRLRIDGTDRPGLFADVAHTINTCDGTILQVRASVTGTGRARILVDLKVRDIEHLYQIIAKINAVKGVIEVIRG